MNGASRFPALLEAFFVDRLIRQRQASAHTITSYRDTFRLLLQYAQQRLSKAPSQMTLSDLDTPLLGAFLDHLEQKRDNSARTRNVRLAAHPFVLPLRRSSCSGVQWAGSARARHAK